MEPDSIFVSNCVNKAKIKAPYKGELTPSVTRTLVNPYTYTGLELEIEDLIYDEDADGEGGLLNDAYFETIGDPSLRGAGGHEIRHIRPFYGLRLIRSVTKLATYLASKPDIVINERCSLHVHVNVLDLTVAELKFLLLTYLGVEKLLYHYCSKEREQNGYCVPMYLSEEEIPKIRALIFNKENYIPRGFSKHINNFGKYSGLNIGSILNRGSLEFRMHQGSTKKEEILEWINIIHSLFSFTKKVGDSPSVLDFFDVSMERGPHNLPLHVFGEKLANKLNYNGMEEDIINGLILGQELVRPSDFHMAVLESDI